MKKKYLVTFDAHNDHERIIEDLLAKGWHSVIQGVDKNGVNVICYLPNTTWYKEFTSGELAYDEMKSIIGGLNAIRIAATAFNEWFSGVRNPMQHQIEEAKKMGLKSAA